MTEAEKRKHCVGCRNNFYNGNNEYGIKECWSLKDAKLVTRYRIGTWVVPTVPGAFAKVRVFDCYHRDGEGFCEKLPHFAVDVRDETKPMTLPSPSKRPGGR